MVLHEPKPISMQVRSQVGALAARGHGHMSPAQEGRAEERQT